MAASHFEGHPQGDKPSETKKTHPTNNWFAVCYDFCCFWRKCLNILPLRAAQNQKTSEQLICGLKSSNFLPLRATQKQQKTWKVILCIKYKHCLAPQATPNENSNILIKISTRIQIRIFWADFKSAHAKYKLAKSNLRYAGQNLGVPMPNLKIPKFKNWLYIYIYIYIEEYMSARKRRSGT